jgi:AcrR family transcriptional regulator
MTEGLTATVEPTRAPKRAAALPADERRSMIVQATLPLLLENGEMVTTRQIADAAGIAEGTIFRVFADKDAVIAAVIDAALDNEPLERALAAIDLSIDFEAAVVAAIEILQQRVVDVWRLVSSIGTRFHDHAKRPMADSDALVTLFDEHRDRLSVEPIAAARLLRAFTLSATHPMLVGEPMSPPEIVKLFLHGVCAGSASC